jgi:hypothetical protein
VLTYKESMTTSLCIYLLEIRPKTPDQQKPFEGKQYIERIPHESLRHIKPLKS